MMLFFSSSLALAAWGLGHEEAVAFHREVEGIVRFRERPGREIEGGIGYGQRIVHEPGKGGLRLEPFG